MNSESGDMEYDIISIDSNSGTGILCYIWVVYIWLLQHISDIYVFGDIGSNRETLNENGKVLVQEG